VGAPAAERDMLLWMRGAALLTTVAIAFVMVLGSAIATLRPGKSAPAVLDERAQAAGKFIDSIGLNVHLSYRSTGYGDAQRVRSLLQQLGVRHLRDGVTPGQTDVCRDDRALAADGLRFTYITSPHPTTAQLTACTSCTGPATEAFEGLNEYDISHPPSDLNWSATVRSSQQDLYHAVKATPSLAGFEVSGPSLTSEAAFRAVGDLSPDLDAGNMHDYFAAHEPETSGWGLGGYGSVAYNIRVARDVAPDKPIDSTETGYGTDRTDRTVDETAQATYLPRLLLDHFAAGVPRTFGYEFLDEGGPPFGHYGIVNSDLSPKPAYVALASLITVLRSGGRNVSATGTLRYTLDGSDASVHHVLLQKADGGFMLAVWLASSGYDSATQQYHAPAPQPLVLTIATPLRSAAIYAYGPDWRLLRTALPAASPLRVTISDRVTLVELVPAANA
jgi:hypothetical protein